MIKFYALILLSLMGLSYGQITGVFPYIEPGVEADWISLVLILIYFLLLFTIYRCSKNTECEYGRSRQRDEVDSEQSNNK